MSLDTTHHVIALSGARTVRQAAETHAEMLAALRQPGEIRLDCTAVTEADISLVQIILAAHRSAREHGQSLALSAPPHGALRSALQRGGFAQPDAADPASWLTGEAAR